MILNVERMEIGEGYSDESYDNIDADELNEPLLRGLPNPKVNRFFRSV